MPSPYATDEDPTSLWTEQAIYASTHIGAVAYGILTAIYALVTHYSLTQKTISWAWFAFNTTLFVMGTVNLATSIHFNQSAWVDERNYPGGPYMFLIEQQNTPVQTVGNTASVVASTLAEGLLLYRVFMIWNRWYIAVIPTLLFLASTALSIVTVIQIALPFSPTWSHMPNFAFTVWMMLMALNLLLSLLLVIRLLRMRRNLQSVMGTQYGKEYTGIAAMVVESALPYGIISIIFLVLFGKRDLSQNLLLPLLVQIECISPMLIILRVIRGQAWSRNTAPDAVSTLAFATVTPSSATEGTGINEASVLNFQEHSKSGSQKVASGAAVNMV